MAEELTIERLGHRGDGIVSGADGDLYVPGALPGERVRAEGAGRRRRIVELIEASPERIAPVCRHHDSCGGCAVQHLSPGAAARWKRRMVIDALADRGIEAAVDETWTAPDASRRRAVFSLARFGGRTVLGFHEARSARILDVAECAVLVPAIAGRLPALRRLGEAFAPRRGEADMHVLSARNGLDVAIAPCGTGRLPPDIVERMTAAGVIRLSLDGALAMQLETPVLDLSGTSVSPPPAAFVQASAEAEREMARLAAGWLSGPGPVADLFCGIGGFALALAGSAPVTAIDSDPAALAALDHAMRGGRGLKPVTIIRRDLFRAPLQAAELRPFAGIVFDPPRAGAAALAAGIAASRVARVVAISCNPATLARDLRLLIDGGYRLRRVVPLDQFRHAAHVEAVALLER